MDAIVTRALTKRYKNRTAVDALYLIVKEGELYALLGQNGAGKTTAIKMLCGLLTPTSGDAELNGYHIVKDTANVKKIINVSPQETAVAAKLSVRENLVLIAMIYGADKKKAETEAESIMRAFGLLERAKDKAKTLSGGMQRRLSIAMALITHPKIVFLDEPTLGLDVRARHDLWKILRELKGKVTIVMTTHYLEEAAALSDRIGIMQDGRLKAVGTAEELIAESGKKTFEEAYLAMTEKEGFEE